MFCIFKTCVITTQLLSGGSYTESIPTTAIDSNDVVHNISQFYAPTNNQFKFKGYVVLDSDVRIDLGYDNGFRSKKRQRTRALDMGIKSISTISNNDFLITGFTTTFGSKTIDKYCVDDDDVAYFCETASLWSLRDLPDNSQKYVVSLKFIRRF
jgi:hypothetical protein